MPTYLHSDLLSRHIALSHGLSPGSREQSPQSSSPKSESKRDIRGDVKAGPDDERRELALRRLSDSIMINLGTEFAQAFNRRVLEQLYFSRFHLHWPILHQSTFQRETQPEPLVQAVLVAGLWMAGTSKAREVAECQLDKIVAIQCENSVNQPF